MVCVQVDDVTIGYPGSPIAANVSFEIAENEFVAICGPNGAGKTTLLKALVGILPLIKGRVCYGFDDREQPLGYVPQRDGLDAFFPLTALDVVLMGRCGSVGLWASFTASDRELARQSLAKVRLEAVSDQLFAELSGGQRQRVLIARALCTEPKVIFLDEPTSGTDPGAEAAIIQLLLDLHQRDKLTVVIVSHHLAVVRALIPSTIFVHDGKVEKGDTSAILDLRRVEEIFDIVEHRP